MSYKDFVKYFSRLEICNLNPDLLTKEQLGEDSNKRWEMSVFEGEWVRGATAGGCRNFLGIVFETIINIYSSISLQQQFIFIFLYLDTFASNPQYRITLEDPDEEDEERKCTIIVALMQKNRRAQRKIGAECLTIGFAVYQVSRKNIDVNLKKYV